MKVNSVQMLTKSESHALRKREWQHYVDGDRGIWVRVNIQRLLVVQDDHVLKSYPCSTAAAGTGSREGSLQTPLGWHEIAEKIGEGLPAGAILRSRRWADEVWKASDASDEDLILSRILRLVGLEEGVNRGGDVDTWGRLIYIHGTNAEEELGRPVSHGCVRLSNNAVIELFDAVDVGCRALISAE